MWTSQVTALAGDCRVITPDQRGFGGSPLGGDPPSLDVAADDLAALLDRLELDRVVLAGLSMGGYLAMAFLRRYPGRVGALGLLDTRAGADSAEAAANRYLLAAALEAQGSAAVLLDMLPALLGATTRGSRPAVVSAVTQLVASAPAAGAAWAQRAMAVRPDSFAVLRSVTVPALVLVGSEDTLSLPVEAEAMAAAIPGAALVRVPDSGHLTAMERPEEVTAALRELVRRARE